MPKGEFSDAHYEAIERGGSVLMPYGEFVTTRDRLDQLGRKAETKKEPKAKDQPAEDPDPITHEK